MGAARIAASACHPGAIPAVALPARLSGKTVLAAALNATGRGPGCVYPQTIVYRLYCAPFRCAAPSLNLLKIQILFPLGD